MGGRSPLTPPTPVAAVVICRFSLYILGPREQVGDWTKDLFRLGLANPSQPLWITAAQPSLVETTLYYDNGAFAEISPPPTSLPLATVLLGLKTARGFQHVFPRRMRKRKRRRCRCCCPCGTFSALVVTKWRALIFFVSSLLFFLPDLLCRLLSFSPPAVVSAAAAAAAAAVLLSALLPLGCSLVFRVSSSICLSPHHDITNQPINERNQRRTWSHASAAHLHGGGHYPCRRRGGQVSVCLILC